MEIEEFIEIYEEEGETGIRGCFVLAAEYGDEDTLIGIAEEDAEKDEIVRIQLK